MSTIQVDDPIVDVNTLNLIADYGRAHWSEHTACVMAHRATCEYFADLRILKANPGSEIAEHDAACSRAMMMAFAPIADEMRALGDAARAARQLAPLDDAVGPAYEKAAKAATKKRDRNEWLEQREFIIRNGKRYPVSKE